MHTGNELTILFQGDSITDASRDYNNPSNLGLGYPMFVASMLGVERSTESYRVFNKGISGNRVKDLKARWKEDCMDLEPDVVSILIGINDTWRKYDSNDPTTAESFEQNYRDILTQAQEGLGASIVLVEPFLLPVFPDVQHMREDLDPKIHIVRKLAREFEAMLVPMDGIFASASAEKNPAFWAADGVHPSSAGHYLIAQSWLRATGLM